MGDTIREKILQYLHSDILPLMRKGNDYSYEFNGDQVERFSMYGPASIELPRIVITSGDEELMDEKPNDINEYDLSVYLSVYIIHDESDRIKTDQHLNRLIGDLKKVLAVDNTVGGYAIDCKPVRISPFANTDEQTYAGVVVELKIKYRQLRTDPTKQS